MLLDLHTGFLEGRRGGLYSHLFKNFPQFVLIHTVKRFGMVNKAEEDVFLELSCFFDDPADVGNLISGSSALSKTSLNIWKFTVHINIMRDQCTVLYKHIAGILILIIYYLFHDVFSYCH